MSREQFPGPLDCVAKGVAGASLFYAGGDASRKSIQRFLTDLFVNPAIGKDPYFSFKKRDQKKDAGILSCSIQPLLIKGAERLQSHGVLPSARTHKCCF